MSYCLNPSCFRPSSNSRSVKFCTSCGSKLLLAERYRAIKQIGQGGFGKTFLAIDEYKLNQRCVIKQFLPQAQGTNNIEKASELFKVEAVHLAELGHTHPQIPELLAYFTQDNQQYLVQEFIDGQNLADELKKNGAFNKDKIIALLNNLLPVLQFVHSKQVIHRDIKPENIIRRSDGELVLVDFGAAKTVTPRALSVTGTVIGTAGYTSPEQAIGKATFASDIYSLGVTCLNLLTQVQPLELFDVTEWKWIWRNYLSSQESDNLAQVLDKMVEYAVKRRYQSAIEVLQALNPPNIAPTIINPPQPNNVQPPQIDNLSSDRNVDYTRLRDLLVAQKWKEADQETLAVMLQATGCDLVGRLSFQAIENFPCTDLHTIDQLWVKYSNGRFGFSVQKQIWESVGRNYDKFGDHVGWRKGRWPNKDWIVYSEVTFDISAPAGHLPLARRQESTPLGGIGWWWANGFSSLVSRIV